MTVIHVARCQNRFEARIVDSPSICGTGPTIDAAIGDLVSENPELLGVEILIGPSVNHYEASRRDKARDAKLEADRNDSR